MVTNQQSHGGKSIQQLRYNSADPGSCSQYSASIWTDNANERQELLTGEQLPTLLGVSQMIALVVINAANIGEKFEVR